MKKLFLFSLSLLLLSACSFEPKRVIPEGVAYEDWIDKEIKDVMQSNDIPALSIGIINEGKITAFKNYGTMKRGSTTAVNDNTIYQIASQTKTLTGIIVNNLIAEGQINIDEPINTYLSDILTADAKKRLESITLQHVLNHTAGFPRSASLVSRERKGNDYWIKGYSEKNFLKDLNQMELDDKVGEKWEYLWTWRRYKWFCL